MKTATVRQLRHEFGTVLGWIEEGEQVDISKRGKIIARISPPPARPRLRKTKRPDFAARLKLRFGDRVIPSKVMNDILDYNKGKY